MSLNFGSICRLCMMQTNTMLPLFSEDGEDGILQNRIMAVVPVIKVCALFPCNKYRFFFLHGLCSGLRTWIEYYDI
jgi:hypothetical protein